MIGFEYIASEVALGPPERAELVLLAPDGAERRTVIVEPRFDDEFGHTVIGVGPAADPTGAVQVHEGSPAAKAGLRSGERVVGVEGAIDELPLSDRLAMAMSDGGPIVLRVLDENGAEREVAIAPEPRPREGPRMLGVGAAANVVRALRRNHDVAALGLSAGDRILRVNGRRVLRPHDLERALLEGLPDARATVERGGERVELALGGLDRARALDLASDVAIASDPERVEVALLTGSPAERAGIRDGDRILEIDGAEIEDWKHFQEVARAAGEESRSLEIVVAREGRDGEIELATVTAAPDEIPELVYGFALRDATYVYRAASLGEAIRVGVRGAAKFLTDAWLMLERMLLGHVSSRNMGGIISIGVVSYHWAGVGWSKLVYFLCLLSLNLAFINVLPIPVLDGGHLFFLAIERIKGSPVSPRVLGYSQTIGLVLILTLLIYVTYWDVERFKGLFFGP
jgi:regulator of sigma E protease